MDRLRNMFASRNYESQDNDGVGGGGSASNTEASTPSSGAAGAAERGAIAEALDATTLSWSTRIQVERRCRRYQTVPMVMCQ